MKPLIIIFGLAPLLLAGCRTQNQEEAFNRDLVDGCLTMNALQALDAGKTNDVQRTELMRLEMCFAGLSTFGTDAHAAPEVKRAETMLAQQTLAYLLGHRRELDPSAPDLQSTLNGLRQILTDPADVSQLKKLSDYLDNLGHMRSTSL